MTVVANSNVESRREFCIRHRVASLPIEVVVVVVVVDFGAAVVVVAIASATRVAFVSKLDS